MAETETYDLVVIGAGPSGVEAAATAALAGMSVCVIGGGLFMGYGLEGAFKSKSLYEIARSHHAVRHRWKLAEGGYDVDFSALSVANSAGAEALRKVHAGQLERLGATLVEGFAHFVDPHTVEVAEQRIRGEYLLVATGTRPRVLPGMTVDGVRIMSSDEAVNIDRSIPSVLILGAGVIGCEFASILASFGTQVTLVDTKDRIFSHDDADISAVLQRSFRSLKMNVIPSARCQGMRVIGGAVHTDLGADAPIVTDAAILAVGRVANTADLNLEVAGVEMDRRGYIPTSDAMQSNIPHIYAAGDVGLRDNEHDLSLVHVGEAEGRRAVHHIAGTGDSLDTTYVPFIIFTLPMVAGAGFSEASARERLGPTIRIGKWANVRNHRSHAMQSQEGFVKLIVAPEGDDRVLGVRAVGEGVDTTVGQVSLMIEHKLPYTHLLDATQAHPSLAESLQGAARIVARTAPAYRPDEEFVDS